MNVQKCANGLHFYDVDSYSSCPHCNGAVPRHGNLTAPVRPGGDPQTVPLDSVVSGGGGEVNPPEDVTVPFWGSDWQGSVKLNPVVGWLVCVDGPSTLIGQSFPLKAGGNFIGREKDMDVAIAGDITVARQKHVEIIYEPNERKFTIHRGGSKELSYLGKKVILEQETLEAGNTITIGKTQLVFVPFCTPENHFWQK